MSEFTKGPWVVVPERDDDDFWQFYINPVDDSPFHMAMSVAKCYTPYDANFIAAAPDMHEALEKVVEQVADYIEADHFRELDDLGDWFADIGLPLMHKALAKARGESHEQK